jgi:hypothetical protein
MSITRRAAAYAAVQDGRITTFLFRRFQLRGASALRGIPDTYRLAMRSPPARTRSSQLNQFLPSLVGLAM